MDLEDIREIQQEVIEEIEWWHHFQRGRKTAGLKLLQEFVDKVFHRVKIDPKEVNVEYDAGSFYASDLQFTNSKGTVSLWYTSKTRKYSTGWVFEAIKVPAAILFEFEVTFNSQVSEIEKVDSWIMCPDTVPHLEHELKEQILKDSKGKKAIKVNDLYVTRFKGFKPTDTNLKEVNEFIRKIKRNNRL